MKITTYSRIKVIISNTVFDFLAETAAEVRARIKINNDTRVVEKGALWYEENVSAEALFFGLVAADRSRNKNHPLSAQDILQKLPSGSQRMQLGGNASVGRGLVNWIKGEK